MGTALPEPTDPLQDCKGKDSPGVTGCYCLVACLACRPGWRKYLRVAAVDEALGTGARPAVRAQEVATSLADRQINDVGQHYPAARAAKGQFPPRRGLRWSPVPAPIGGGGSPGYSP